MKQSILIVDDERAVLQSIKRLLRQNDYQIDTASDAREALAKLDREQYAVILSDHRLPGMTGTDFLHKVRSQQPEATRILLTGHADINTLEKAVNKAHIFNYSAKPWNDKQLVNTIRKAFNYHQHKCQQKQIGELINTNIASNKNQLQKLSPAIHHDALSGLPNRPLFLSKIGYILKHEKKPDDEFALLVICIDNIKKYNDSHGHLMGDKILRKIIRRIRRYLKDSDLLARLDGDELGLFTLFSSIHPLIGQIQSAIRQPAVMGDMSMNLTASIGISLTPQHGSNAQKLLQKSSTSMNAQKQRGGDGFSVYTPDMSNLIRQKMEIENDLRQAVEKQQLRVLYQPKFNLKKGVIESAEALVRWQHPQKGLIPPNKFIPVAEETGMINGIGEWVLNQVIEDSIQWQKQGFKPVCCAVNLSAVQMQDQQLSSKIRQLLHKNKLPEQWLELELTESMAILGQEQILKTIFKLKKIGLILSIDDFGTGYSALGYLKKLPVDALKIDRCFITDLAKSSEDEELVKNIINMAHGLGLKVIAEGVETVEQLNKLDELGCDSVQGFLLSRPLTRENFMRLLIPEYSTISDMNL